MVGPAFFIIGALAVLPVYPSSALTTQEATSVCALVPDGEQIANPLDCSQFYLCSKGKAILSSCLGSNSFSKESQACVPPNQSSCGSEEDSDPCANMSDGYFVSDPNSCSGFYYCTDGKSVKSSCGSGLNFDQANQACKYPSEYPCKETAPGEGNTNICEVVRSGIYFGVSSSCKAWQKCQVNGPSEIDDCPSPYFFNVDTAACDYEDNVSCRQLQATPGTGGSGPSLEGTACNTNGEVQADTTCSGYYVCTNGIFAFGKCINGQYFNPPTNQCVPRLDAINDCDRCEGTKLPFVNIYQDNCIGYAYCHNGKTQSTGECKSGYFSEVGGSCVQNGKNPEYPVCYVPEEPATISPTESTEASSDKTDPKPTTDSITSESTESATKSTTNSEPSSTTKSATKSTTESATESTKEPPTESATKSTTESATESSKEPTTESATKSTTESATEPTKAPATESAPTKKPDAPEEEKESDEKESEDKESEDKESEEK